MVLNFFSLMVEITPRGRNYPPKSKLSPQGRNFPPKVEISHIYSMVNNRILGQRRVTQYGTGYWGQKRVTLYGDIQYRHPYTGAEGGCPGMLIFISNYRTGARGGLPSMVNYCTVYWAWRWLARYAELQYAVRGLEKGDQSGELQYCIRGL